MRQNCASNRAAKPCGKSVASTDAGPAVLVLAAPEAVDQLSEQFQRFLLAEAPRAS